MLVSLPAIFNTLNYCLYWFRLCCNSSQPRLAHQILFKGQRSLQLLLWKHAVPFVNLRSEAQGNIKCMALCAKMVYYLRVKVRVRFVELWNKYWRKPFTLAECGCVKCNHQNFSWWSGREARGACRPPLSSQPAPSRWEGGAANLQTHSHWHSIRLGHTLALLLKGTFFCKLNWW